MNSIGISFLLCDTTDPIQEMNQPISSDNPDGEETPETPGNDDSNNDDENPMNNNLKITVGSVSFSAIIEEKETTREG